MNFAKALAKLEINERSSVAIMGFNCPQWFFACIGSILYNCVITGIYATNSSEACYYQTHHSEAEIIVVENFELLKRFDAQKLSKVKAFVVWGEKKLPDTVDKTKVFLWNDFIKIGEKISDSIILEKVSR